MTPIQIAGVLTMVVLFNVKHFLGDFLLQNEYMLGKFKRVGWQLPLLAHVASVAQFTFWITIITTHEIVLAISLTLFDMSTHMIIDRLKASPDHFGKYKPTDRMFWLVLGCDQMLHHIVDAIIIFLILCTIMRG